MGSSFRPRSANILSNYYICSGTNCHSTAVWLHCICLLFLNTSTPILCFFSLHKCSLPQTSLHTTRPLRRCASGRASTERKLRLQATLAGPRHRKTLPPLLLLGEILPQFHLCCRSRLCHKFLHTNCYTLCTQFYCSSATSLETALRRKT